MQDEDFEWDDAKAASNLEKHKVSFDAARHVFADVFALEQIDERYVYGEPRYTVIGMVENRLLMVVYTEKEGRIRLISARAPEPFERRRYHEHNTR